MEIIKTKYLIIGSGPGGITIGLKLSKQKQGVMIIEEGKNVDTSDKTLCNSLMNSWKNNGITPVLGDKNLVLGQGKCLGGGSSLNAGLIWKTPEFILNRWKKKYQNSFFDNFDKNYELIRDRLDISNSNNIINKHTQRIINGANKLKWKYLSVQHTSGQNSNNLDAFGVSKVSLINNYLKDYRENGGNIITNLRLEKIIFKYNKIDEVICFDTIKNINVKIKADYYFMCCGSIQTPFILKKNKIISNTISSQYHCNLRFLPIFNDDLDIQKDTFASHEINEFQQKGLMIIPSEYKLKYLPSIISGYSNYDIKNILNSINYGGIYVAQLKMVSKIKINVVNFIKDPILTNYLTKDDKELIRFSINKTIELLFESGAKVIYLPFAKNYKITKHSYSSILSSIKSKNLNMISVHLMSSIPLFKSNIINEYGRIKEIDNLYISDASILPENIGQSPQGTIMLFSMELAERFLENEK